jgi:hypothetical protein
MHSYPAYFTETRTAAPFIASHQTPPRQLVLDADASDVPLHGHQELKQFHGHYNHYCYLPLYVLLASNHPLQHVYRHAANALST